MTTNFVGLQRLKNLTLKQPAWWQGLLLVGFVAVAGILAAKVAWISHLGLSALTLAIIFGIVVGNTLFPKIAQHTAVGVDFSKNTLLRAGVILYGFRITFQQVIDIGWLGIAIDLLMITLTFTIAVQLGIHLFKLDRQTAVLIGAGSSICGAAAVMATEPVVKAQAHKVSVAVATVVVFGTLSMFLYPLVYPYLHLSAQAYGVYAGSTIHEVAQVVGAGKAVSDAAANTAVIEKMLRVMMLAPFLVILSTMGARQNHDEDTQQSEGKMQRTKITIPWFAVIFILASALNSLHLLPQVVVHTLVAVDTVLLAMAMAALGLRTHVGAIRQAGVKPLLLALTLFLFLTVGGYGINVGVTHLFTVLGW
ncbi:YeiH family putative sulfate export transporter [Alteromonadaceae bacterium A_SAG2]|nr:YeiH family putative sulfate export transporter [Alteromonadaceae bacterium A_SAG2]|tara:strand:- start:4176 stop:5267 length:1092 start_codon:yes stop_codon:yes gene_type:complete